MIIINLILHFLKKRLRFKQLVKNSTRREKILDKIFTNLFNYYDDASVLPPLGKSDHNCVAIRPKSASSLGVPIGKTVVRRRIFSEHIYDCIAYDLSKINWSSMYRLDDVQSQANFFYDIMLSVVDAHAPICSSVYKNNEKPWITQHFKALIEQRNSAYERGDTTTYNYLRNKVNRMRKGLQKVFYNNRIESLKRVNNSRWWSEVKKLTGLDKHVPHDLDRVSRDGVECDPSQLPEAINDFLSSITAVVEPLEGGVLSDLRSKLSIVPDEYVVSEFDVYMKLIKLNIRKSSMSDAINNRLLRKLADVILQV